MHRHRAALAVLALAPLALGCETIGSDKTTVGKLGNGTFVYVCDES